MTLDVTRGHSQADAITVEQRQQCVRLLLRHPLIHDRGPQAEGFVLVRRHGAWLGEFFAEQLGYRLVVEPSLARLRKRPVPSDAPRPLSTRSRAPFDRRRYTLFCLVLAALEDVEVQTTLTALAEQVKLHSTEVAGCAALDLDRHAERQAFVDVVRSLVDVGVLRLTDGDDADFVGGQGDALYDVDPRLRAQMLACSVPPSVAATAAALAADPYADTDAGANRRARHQLMRRLLEEPVLYADELDDREATYLASQRHALLSQVVAATGADVEVRAEGIAVVDPAGDLTDLRFPTAGTESHAALLLGQRLLAHARAAGNAAAPMARSELRAALDELAQHYRAYWSKAACKDSVSRSRLFEDALGRLEALRLVRSTPEGVVALPALGRFRLPDREER